MDIKLTKKKFLRIKADGWPWQTIGGHWSMQDKQGSKWGWNPLKDIGMGRFGGGWGFKLGVLVSSSFNDFVFELIFGSIRIQIKEFKDAQKP